MTRMKSTMLAALVGSAVFASLASPASAAREFYVEGNAIAAAREYRSIRQMLTGGARLESYIVTLADPYTFTCYSAHLDGKLQVAGGTENELTLTSCKLSKYSENHEREEVLSKCTVATPIALKFKGKLTEVVGNQLWEGKEAAKEAGKIKVEGGECAMELVGNYTVKGEQTCSLYGVEVEWPGHWLYCAPVGLPEPETYTLTKAGAAALPLRMRFGAVLTTRNGAATDPLWSAK